MIEYLILVLVLFLLSYLFVKKRKPKYYLKKSWEHNTWICFVTLSGNVACLELSERPLKEVLREWQVTIGNEVYYRLHYPRWGHEEESGGMMFPELRDPTPVLEAFIPVHEVKRITAQREYKEYR